MSGIKVSVIVPVYNTEQYIAQCLDSILGQSLKDIEILCVNDGSTDSSLHIMEGYAKRDKRVIVIDLEKGNQGPGFARNFALTKANGDYISFVDSDDYIHSEMLKEMYENAIASCADVVMCAIKRFSDNSKGMFPKCQYYKNIPKHLDSLCFSWLDLKEILFKVRFVCWNKIYNKNFLCTDNIKFSEGIFYEDMIFTYKALLCAKNIRFLRKEYYYNRKHRIGATTFTQGSRAYDIFTAFDELGKFIAENHRFQEMEQPFAAFKGRTLINYMNKNDSAYITPYYKKLKKYLVTELDDKNPYLDKKTRETMNEIKQNELFEFLVTNYWKLTQNNARLKRENRRLERQSMKRIYKHIKHKVKTMIVTMIKVPVVRVLFKLTHEPKCGFYLASYYTKRSATHKAIAIYQTMYNVVSRSKRSSIIKRKHQLQFKIQREMYKRKASFVDEPLLNMNIIKGNTEVGNSAGTFKVQLRPLGLRIEGRVLRIEETSSNLPPEAVEILLDGNPIRRENLYFVGKDARFGITIKRPTLAHFPRCCELRICTTKGLPLLFKKADGLYIEFPHGKGDIYGLIKKRGFVDKKGYLRPSIEESKKRQEAYLDFYSRVRDMFEKTIGRPPFLLFGTLLGFYRDGDFIAGDDDFDVGYISKEQDPVAVKNEAKKIIFKLIQEGFTIVINKRGKPFRILDTKGSISIHMDLCPVWYQKNKIWASPGACLPLKIEDMLPDQVAEWKGVKVYIPANTEAFLAAYYGENWSVPDPTYSLPKLDSYNQKIIQKSYFSPRELMKLEKHIKKEQSQRNDVGDFIAIRLHDLYPLSEYESRCGF